MHTHAHGTGLLCHPLAVIVTRVPAQPAAAQVNHSEPPSGCRTCPGVRGGWLHPRPWQRLLLACPLLRTPTAFVLGVEWMGQRPHCAPGLASSPASRRGLGDRVPAPWCRRRHALALRLAGGPPACALPTLSLSQFAGSKKSSLFLQSVINGGSFAWNYLADPASLQLVVPFGVSPQPFTCDPRP